MLGIDPERVGQAVDEIRAIAQTADTVVDDIRRATVLADVSSGADRLLIELIDELGLLAVVLTERAEQAQAFRLPLPSPDGRRATLDLWRSIRDHRGRRSAMAGDNALAVLLTVGDGPWSRSDLKRLAADQTRPAPVRDAARVMLEEGLFDMVVDDAVSAEELGQRRSDHPIRIDSVGAAQIGATLAINASIRRRIDAGDRSQVALAVNRFVFAGDAPGARGFIATMPSAVGGETGIDVSTVETVALAALHHAALTGVARSDLRLRYDVLSRLPESTDGYRNQQISGFYGRVARQLDHLVNPDVAGDPTARGHAGLNWAHFGASASYSVGPTIRGDQRSYLVAPPPSIRQAFADGNQLILTDVGLQYVRLLELFGDGDVTGARVEAFLAGFEQGQRDLQIAFGHQLAAITEQDPVRRQELQLLSNIGVGVHEQAIVDHLVDFERLPIGQRIGSHIVSTLASGLLRPWPVPDGRSPSEIASDDGVLVVPGRDGRRESIPVGQPLTSGPTRNRLVDHVDFRTNANPAQLSLDRIPLPGDLTDLPLLDGVSERYGLSNDVSHWRTDLAQVERWDRFDERMPFIAEMMREHHTNPAFVEGADHLAQAAS